MVPRARIESYAVLVLTCSNWTCLIRTEIPSLSRSKRPLRAMGAEETLMNSCTVGKTGTQGILPMALLHPVTTSYGVAQKRWVGCMRNCVRAVGRMTTDTTSCAIFTNTTLSTQHCMGAYVPSHALHAHRVAYPRLRIRQLGQEMHMVMS